MIKETSTTQLVEKTVNVKWCASKVLQYKMCCKKSNPTNFSKSCSFLSRLEITNTFARI